MTEEQKTFADQKRKTVETAEFTEDGRYKRKVRSFVLRTGRLSDFQKNMMNDHWADLGLDYQNAPFDFAVIYGNTNPVILEIGFGMGKSLVDMAEANPDKNYLGIEVHTPGVGACIAYAVEKGVKNNRFPPAKKYWESRFLRMRSIYSYWLSSSGLPLLLWTCPFLSIRNSSLVVLYCL